jgi:hypothetical protein
MHDPRSRWYVRPVAELIPLTVAQARGRALVELYGCDGATFSAVEAVVHSEFAACVVVEDED